MAEGNGSIKKERTNIDLVNLTSVSGVTMGSGPSRKGGHSRSDFKKFKPAMVKSEKGAPSKQTSAGGPSKPLQQLGQKRKP